MIPNYISKVQSGNTLTKEESAHCLRLIFDNEASQGQVEVILKGLYKNGESVSEIIGFAQTMRAYMNKIELGNRDVIDLCGTGGSGKDRFNVSTAMAFIVAAGGCPVAKHGNYGSKKPNGSFNFLESLDVPINISEDQIKAVFNDTGLCFLFARQFHPAMKAVAPVRQGLGHRSIFNLLGPLCNPASVNYQLIGTIDTETAEKLASAVQELGTKKTLIIVGGDGRDELSITGQNHLYEVTTESITQTTLSTEAWGLSYSEYACGDSQQNAQLFQSVMSQNDYTHPMAVHVSLNAGAAFYCTGKVATVKDGYDLAQDIIKSGKGWMLYQRVSNVLSQKI